MAEYHFPIPGAKDEKEIVVFARRHWASFLGQFVLSFLFLVIPIIILVIIYVFNFDRRIFQGLAVNFLTLVLSAYYLVGITFAFVAWMSFYYNCYIITRQEIVEITQVGFFGRKISQLSVLRVQDFTSSINGLLPTLFSYGNVLVETASEQKESIILQSVPNPQEISSKIMALHDEVIASESREQQILDGEGTLTPPKAPPPSPPASPPPEKTPEQELLTGEKADEDQSLEGEISKNDLDKGGEIEIK